MQITPRSATAGPSHPLAPSGSKARRAWSRQRAPPRTGAASRSGGPRPAIDGPYALLSHVQGRRCVRAFQAVMYITTSADSWLWAGLHVDSFGLHLGLTPARPRYKSRGFACGQRL